MCKKYINANIEEQIEKVISLMSDIVSPDLSEDKDSHCFITVRSSRKKLLSARGHISLALRMCGELERVRYQKK